MNTPGVDISLRFKIRVAVYAIERCLYLCSDYIGFFLLTAGLGSAGRDGEGD